MKDRPWEPRSVTPLRWILAIVATIAWAPWMTPGGVFALGMGILGAIKNAAIEGLYEGPVFNGLFVYGVGGWSAVAAVPVFAVAYALARRRLYSREWIAIGGAVLGLAAVFSTVVPKFPEAGRGLQLLIAANGASAGFFGALMFMRIVDGPTKSAASERPRTGFWRSEYTWSLSLILPAFVLLYPKYLSTEFSRCENIGFFASKPVEAFGIRVPGDPRICISRRSSHLSVTMPWDAVPEDLGLANGSWDKQFSIELIPAEGNWEDRIDPSKRLVPEDAELIMTERGTRFLLKQSGRSAAGSGPTGEYVAYRRTPNPPRPTRYDATYQWTAEFKVEFRVFVPGHSQSWPAMLEKLEATGDWIRWILEGRGEVTR